MRRPLGTKSAFLDKTWGGTYPGAASTRTPKFRENSGGVISRGSDRTGRIRRWAEWPSRRIQTEFRIVTIDRVGPRPSTRRPCRSPRHFGERAPSLVHSRISFIFSSIKIAYLHISALYTCSVLHEFAFTLLSLVRPSGFVYSTRSHLNRLVVLARRFDQSGK